MPASNVSSGVPSLMQSIRTPRSPTILSSRPMEKTERPWIAAERAITQELEDFQRRAADMWQGREKEAVIALVRVLDRFTITRLLDDASGRTVDPDRANDRFFVLMGAATALRPFLAAIKDQPGGVPWGPLNADVSEFA